MGSDIVWQWIVIGAAGGAMAGVTVWLIKELKDLYWKWRHKRRVFKWLQQNTGKPSYTFRTTRAIASWNNLTEDRVSYICSIHDKIFLSTGPEEDRWSLSEEIRKGWDGRVKRIGILLIL